MGLSIPGSQSCAPERSLPGIGAGAWRAARSFARARARKHTWRAHSPGCSRSIPARRVAAPRIAFEEHHRAAGAPNSYAGTYRRPPNRRGSGELLLGSLGREEPLEEQVAARRIDRRDAETKTDGAVRGAAPSLAEDVAIPGHLDDGLNAQEIRRDLDLSDELELFLDLRAHAGGQAVRVAVDGALVGQAAQGFVGCFSFDLRAPRAGRRGRAAGDARKLAREAIFELAHREPTSEERSGR